MNQTEQGSTVGFIKNREKFLFGIDRQGRVTTSSKDTLVSDDHKIRIFLNGVLYNHNGKELVEGFYSHGVDYIDQVEGSFVIFLIDGSQFYILTDKVNSRKAFYGFIDDGWVISNDIDALPTDKCQLSLDGIACYLANGNLFVDLTLFQEIKCARRASVHVFKEPDVFIYSYWEYKFTNPAYSVDQFGQYAQELESLLVESIKRRYATASGAALSLSAGLDSRGILGILHDRIKAPDIHCFSYSSKEHPEIDTDPALSRQLASLCGYSHEMILSYKGDLVGHLQKNAREGKCLANFCDELDAWHSLTAAGQFSDVFVGDECFGIFNQQLDSQPMILAWLGILDAAAIRGLEDFIPKGIYARMCQSLNKLTDEIFDRAKEIPDLYTKRDFLYLDQRIDHVMMPWREYFAGQVGFVHNPYVDGSILEFVKRLPAQLRTKRILYKNTIRNMLPGLFSVDVAASSGNHVNWHNEILKHKDELIALVQSTDSRLDDIIPKKKVLDAIRNYGSWILRMKRYLIQAFLFFGRNRFVDKALEPFFGSRNHSEGPMIGSQELLFRLLLIRIYLSPPSSEL
jgi:asparagine synthase (glutamine-hydrolysing)